MKRIFMTADLHGDYRPIRDFAKLMEGKGTPLTIFDTIIVLGDAGFNFFLDRRDEKLKRKLGEYKIQFFVIRGNHEQRASICAEKNPDDWTLEPYYCNFVLVEKKFSYIKYALDIPAHYQIPIEGESVQVLSLPGAYSVDKEFRLINNLGWFSKEQCTKEEREHGTSLAKNKNWDMILSHTCPFSFQPTDLFLSVVDQSMVDNTTERWLDQIERETDYKLWAFGHYHRNRIYSDNENYNMLMLFNNGFFDITKYFSKKTSIKDCLIPLSDKIIIDNFSK